MPPSLPPSPQKEQDVVEKSNKLNSRPMYNKYGTKDTYLFPLCNQVTVCITLVEAKLIKLL